MRHTAYLTCKLFVLCLAVRNPVGVQSKYKVKVEDAKELIMKSIKNAGENLSELFDHNGKRLDKYSNGSTEPPPLETLDDENPKVIRVKQIPKVCKKLIRTPPKRGRKKKTKKRMEKNLKKKNDDADKDDDSEIDDEQRNVTELNKRAKANKNQYILGFCTRYVFTQ